MLSVDKFSESVVTTSIARIEVVGLAVGSTNWLIHCLCAMTVFVTIQLYHSVDLQNKKVVLNLEKEKNQLYN